MKNNKVVSFFFSVGICFLAGIVGSIFTYPAIKTWYVFLNKSSFNPPNWIFGPVWSLLYLMMAVALYLAINSKTKKIVKNQGLKYFYIQLVLNLFWSVIFFGAKLPLAAFFEIIFLWVFIFITIMKFMKINKVAAALLIPYLIWVSFASVLNLFIAVLN
ncbi:tryptophan-rich sensory protein [Candidatus Roizmanbacteria bacterium]|jgi:tryptophan-rich sensory protein|nr:tryptophan-rich sensory protein [Candidatus Roizmanbacteria bacterium]